MSSIAVLYGTTADDNVRPVLCNDSGQLVTDQSGGTNWYDNLYVGGTSGDPSISLLSSGEMEVDGTINIAGPIGAGGNTAGLQMLNAGTFAAERGSEEPIWLGFQHGDADFTSAIFGDGTFRTDGEVYAKQFIDSDGYDLGKIGQALSTIHDVIESVDDLQGLKNLFHHLFDNLKTDPTPPEPPEESTETPE